MLIPQGKLVGINPIGGAMPKSGWYTALCTKIAHAEGDDADVERMHLKFTDAGPDTGFETFDFIHAAFDTQGNPLPGLTEKQVSGRLGATVSKLQSAGYTPAQYEASAVGSNWLEGRNFYIGWVEPVQGVKGSYGQVTFWPKDKWETNKASGQVPVRREQAGKGDAGASQQYQAPPTPAAPPPPGGTSPGPVNPPPPGGTSTSAGALPPPPPPPPGR